MSSERDLTALTASQVLAQRRDSTTATSVGVDALYTQITVDLLRLQRDTLNQTLSACLGTLIDATGVDAAFIALPGADSGAIDDVIAATTVFSACNPQGLCGMEWSELPWLTHAVGENRLVEIRDTADKAFASVPEVGRLAALKLGAVLAVGVRAHSDADLTLLVLGNERPVKSWDANMKLLLKQLGAALEAGLTLLDS
ncbi:MAG: hypothetical protein AAFX58_10005, partial [Pseudomonadota bacterium]